MTDARIAELEALAFEEGFRLPMAANLIAYFEARGYVVDLQTGEVCHGFSLALSPNAQALCHLYGVTDADIAAIFAPVEDEAIDWDLFDYDAELAELRDAREEEEWMRRGCP